MEPSRRGGEHAQKTEIFGGKWARYALRSVDKEGAGGITCQSASSRSCSRSPPTSPRSRPSSFFALSLSAIFARSSASYSLSHDYYNNYDVVYRCRLGKKATQMQPISVRLTAPRRSAAAPPRESPPRPVPSPPPAPQRPPHAPPAASALPGPAAAASFSGTRLRQPSGLVLPPPVGATPCGRPTTLWPGPPAPPAAAAPPAVAPPANNDIIS
eukprot:COSAG04_NODE_2265_length_4421_cov_18.722119_4_plen_213_part_00